MEHTITTLAQLGHVLKGCRRQRGLTQRELGAKVGLLQKAVSALESDPSRASVERLFRLLSALELELVLRDKRPRISPAPRRSPHATEW